MFIAIIFSILSIIIELDNELLNQIRLICKKNDYFIFLILPQFHDIPNNLFRFLNTRKLEKFFKKFKLEYYLTEIEF